MYIYVYIHIYGHFFNGPTGPFASHCAKHAGDTPISPDLPVPLQNSQAKWSNMQLVISRRGMLKHPRSESQDLISCGKVRKRE